MKNLSLGNTTGALIRAFDAKTPAQVRSQLRVLKDTPMGNIVPQVCTDRACLPEWRVETANVVKSPLTASLGSFTERLASVQDPRAALDAEDLDTFLVTSAHRLGLLRTEGVLEFLDVVADRKACSFGDPVGAMLQQQSSTFSVYGERSAVEVNSWHPPADVLSHGFIIENMDDHVDSSPGPWLSANRRAVKHNLLIMWGMGIDPKHLDLADYTASELVRLNERIRSLSADQAVAYTAAIRQVFDQHAENPIYVKMLLGEMLEQLTDQANTIVVKR